MRFLQAQEHDNDPRGQRISFYGNLNGQGAAIPDSHAIVVRNPISADAGTRYFINLGGWDSNIYQANGGLFSWAVVDLGRQSIIATRRPQTRRRADLTLT